MLNLRVLELSQELLLVHDGVNTPFLNDSPLVHFLHSKQLLLLFLFYLPHFSKATSPNNIVEEEVVFSGLYKGM